MQHDTSAEQAQLKEVEGCVRYDITVTKAARSLWLNQQLQQGVFCYVTD